KAEPFRLSFSYRCLLGMRPPTAAMAHRTRQLDAAPPEGSDVKPNGRIESDHEEIAATAAELVDEEQKPGEQVEKFFQYVKGLENEPSVGPGSALKCLHNGGGNSEDKSRLLIALCRNRGIPARLVNGLIMETDREQGLHHWAEAWVDKHWQPMCPTYGHFG